MNPREIVFKLNGGGEATPDGPVDRPALAVVVGVVPVPAVVVVVAAPPGDTSGESTPPRAYSDRFRPYCLARTRFTSRISTSNMISARALSFCSITFSMICTTDVVPRTVIVFAVLLN